MTRDEYILELRSALTSAINLIDYLVECGELDFQVADKILEERKRFANLLWNKDEING